jgi:hypothetical protein
LRLFVGVNIDPLRVLDQLPLQCLGVVDINDASGNRKQVGKLRGTKAPGSRDDLKAGVVGPDGDGLDEAVGADALGLMFRKRLCGRCGFQPHG